jgi:hypothetical protein
MWATRVGLSKDCGQAGRTAGSLMAPGGGRGRDLPGLSTGRHFHSPSWFPETVRSGSDELSGAKRRKLGDRHGAGVMVATRSESATGSSQEGQGPPGPSRRQNAPQSGQR